MIFHKHMIALTPDKLPQAQALTNEFMEAWEEKIFDAYMTNQLKEGEYKQIANILAERDDEASAQIRELVRYTFRSALASGFFQGVSYIANCIDSSLTEEELEEIHDKVQEGLARQSTDHELEIGTIEITKARLLGGDDPASLN